MELIPLRLLPGDDLRRSLEQLVHERRLPAAFVVSAVGSLSRATLRYASAEVPTMIERPLEIVSLSGTMALESAHLHMSVADSRGEVLGGHVMKGCIVGSTVELVVGVAERFAFARRHDPATGSLELVIEPRARVD